MYIGSSCGLPFDPFLAGQPGTQNTVYAEAFSREFGHAYGPITITFESPVTNFSVEVYRAVQFYITGAEETCTTGAVTGTRRPRTCASKILYETSIY